MRNCASIASYKNTWRPGNSKSKKQWYDDLGEEISQGLMQFRDTVSFVYPAAVTVYVAPFRKTEEKAFNKAKPRTPHSPAVIKPPAPHVISAPTMTAPEPGETTRVASAIQAQIPRQNDTGTFEDASQAPASAQRPGKRSKAKKAASLVDIAEEAASPACQVVKIVDSGASSTMVDGAFR